MSGEVAVGLLKTAERIHQLAVGRWGADSATEIVGQHPRLEAALNSVVRFAAVESPALITGETGVGKELFARALFVSSRRSKKPFIPVNCAQYSSDHLVGSELFGHRKGAFTGATSDHHGVFGEADGGSVFLDEVGELTPSAQAMLLRVIGEGEILPVGGTRAKKIDVRVVAATNRNLSKMVDEGRFRRDLYYRLKCLVIDVPSLRDRGNDWELIAGHYLRRLREKHTKAKELTPETIRALGQYRWPGNVRELKNVIETGYHLSDTEEIRIGDLGFALEERARRVELGRFLGDFAMDLCQRLVSR